MINIWKIYAKVGKIIGFTKWILKNITATKIQKSEQKIFATFLIIFPRIIVALKEFARLNEIKVKTLRFKKIFQFTFFIFYRFYKIFLIEEEGKYLLCYILNYFNYYIYNFA